MLSDRNEVVPHVTEGAHVAELAGDRLRADQGVARDNARLPAVLALRALKRSLIQLVIVAELTDTRWKLVTHIAIHVDFEDPVTNLISLSLLKHVLLGQRDLVRNRNIGALEVGVLGDHVGLRVDDGVPQVDIPVEEDESHVVLADGSARIACIQECLVCPNVLAVAKKRRAEFGIASVEVVLAALAL